MNYNEYFKVPNNNASDLEKIAIIKENYTIASALRAKIKSIKAYEHRINNLEFPKETSIVTEEKQEPLNEYLQKLINKISILDTSNLSDEEIIKEFKEDLKNIIFYSSKIKVYLYLEINEYFKMLLEVNNEQEKEEIKKAIQELKRKIIIIDNLEEEQELIETASNDNNIYFLTSKNGNIYFLENIRKNVPQEQYKQVLILLESIKNGTFTNLKRLETLKYFEVRLNQIRITFAKLSNDSFLVIDCFIKKVNTSSLYKNMLRNKSTQYLEAKEYYIDNLSNQKFTSIHKKYYEDICEFLNGRNIGGPTLC